MSWLSLENPTKQSRSTLPSPISKPRHCEDVGANPSNLRRRCTDVSWLVAYGAYSGLIIYMGIVVWPQGQPMALLTLTDWTLGARRRPWVAQEGPQMRPRIQRESEPALLLPRRHGVLEAKNSVPRS